MPIQFNGCTVLETLTYGENCSLEIIGEGAFTKCGFYTVTFPKSVKTIEKDAFAECENLQSIHFPEYSLLESVGKKAKFIKS